MGNREGDKEGDREGDRLGQRVGSSVGVSEGNAVGPLVGSIVGEREGDGVGPGRESRFTTLFPLSTTSSEPSSKESTAVGKFSAEDVAATPLGPAPAVLVPATVDMAPVALSTTRTAWLLRSAMKTLPLGATATPKGHQSSAAVAGPPSPVEPFTDCALPAKVDTRPLATRRMRLLYVSVM